MESPEYRIQIEDYGYVSISPIASLYSLKEQIRDSFFPDNHMSFQVYRKEKLLSEDSHSLLQLGIQKDDVLSVKGSLLGGDDNKLWFLWLLYYLAIPVFLFFLISGVLPLVSSTFNIIVKLGLNFILSKFGVLDKIPNWMKSIGSFFLWMIQTFFIVFFVWAVCAYMIFPHLYGRQGRKCESGIAAKQIGKWCMYAFIAIYFLLNIPDIFLGILSGMTDKAGLIIKAPVAPLLSTLREVSDVSKFVPFYAIPIAGQMLMLLHSGIDSVLSFLFMFLDDLSQFSCDDTESMKEIEDLLGSLIQMTMATDKSSGTFKKIAQKRLEKKMNGVSTFGLRTKDKAHNEHIEKQASNLMNQPGANTSVGSKLMMANMIQYVKDFKLEPSFKLMFMGLQIGRLKQEYATSKNVDVSTVSTEMIKDQLSEWMKKENSFTWWVSEQARSFGCELLESQEGIRDILYSVGTEFQISNMVKTGGIAGMLTAFVWLILFILTWFKSCIANQCYG